MRNIKVLHLGFILTLLWAMPAFGQVIVDFQAINDGYVHNLEPNESFGHETSMLIGAKNSTEGSICHSYVQFDMAGYDGDPIESAMLYLYVGNTAPAGQEQTFSLYLGAGDSWAQDTLTWNNAPGFLPTALTARSGSFPAGWIGFDVTEVVSIASEVGNKISFATVQDSGPLNSWLSFSTSEWVPLTTERPYLRIRFDGTVPAANASLDEVKALYLRTQ